MVLEHESEVLEAGLTRRVQLTLAAVALGDLARMLAGTPLGSVLQVEGFLAPTRKGSRRVKLHMQQAQRVQPKVDLSVVQASTAITDALASPETNSAGSSGTGRH